jgi:hypothetical protein
MVCETTEGVLWWKNAIRKENEEEERNGENEEVVVGQGFGEMTVEDGMSGTLDATGWTLSACEDSARIVAFVFVVCHSFLNEEWKNGFFILHSSLKEFIPM